MPNASGGMGRGIPRLGPIGTSMTKGSKQKPVQPKITKAKPSQKTPKIKPFMPKIVTTPKKKK